MGCRHPKAFGLGTRIALLLSCSALALAAGVRAKADTFVCPAQPGDCTVPSSGVDNVIFDYTASQGSAEDDDGDNAGASSFTNTETIDFSQSDGDAGQAILFGVIGGRGYDASAGQDASRGGDGGTLSFTNTGIVEFFGTGAQDDDNGDPGSDPGVYDDLGALMTIKIYGVGGDGGDVSSGVGGGDGGNGGQGGQFDLIDNRGNVTFEPGDPAGTELGTAPFGGAAIYVGAISGSGGAQDDTAGDQDGGDAGDGRTITVSNSGSIEAKAETANRFFWGIGVEAIGNAGGDSNGPGGQGGEIAFTSTERVDVRANAGSDGLPLGLRGIYLASVGGPGFSQTTSDNDDDGGRGEEGQQIVATISDDVTVEGDGIAPPEDGWDPDLLDQDFDLDRFTTSTNSGTNGTLSTVAQSTGALQQSGGVVIYSRGGDGGIGPQRVGSDDRSGGTGGDASFVASTGSAGQSILTLDSAARVKTEGDFLPGLVAFSVGGAGGAGREDSSGAPGGYGGDVTIQVEDGAEIETNDDFAPGAWVRSEGGPGGYFSPSSGVVDFTADDSGDGGSGGLVRLELGVALSGVDLVATGPISIDTDGDVSHGAVAQSLGSQGGPTGDDTELLGQSTPVTGRGGSGGRVLANFGGDIDTDGDNARGILLQSVGDSGGAGGTASGIVVLGGSTGSGGTRDDGGAAGTGGEIQVTSIGDISTGGDGAPGLQALSIGGGGGTGASADGVFVVGGQGGHGGAGGPVSVFPVGGSLETRGVFAYGIAAQSVGGGGGDGGAIFSVSSDFVDRVSSAVGGNGGVGGDGGEVLITSTPLFTLDGVGEVDPLEISTRDDNAHGILAQSVGGGGGSGGNAIGFGIAASTVPIAGGADSGGSGGTASFALESFSIETGGSHASGILAQSIGGGGGTGGSASALSADFLFDWSASVGGSGGEGGNGGAIDMALAGGEISTGSGDEFDAFGVVAQSIGGGGGTGGSSVSKALAQALSLGDIGIAIGASASAAVGGTGGAAGDGGAVDLSFVGTTITTLGDGSIGLIAQSVGAGGGNGGSSSASAGVRGPEDEEAVSFTATLSVAVGGSGNAGGDGGEIDLALDQTSAIETFGDHAAGLLAQSIGGGGGNGGIGSATTGNNDGDFQLNATIGVGGTGGQGGLGGAITLAADAGSQITTHGSGARGLIAQSIGHGGGTSQGGTFGISGSASGSDSEGNEFEAAGSLTVSVGARGVNNFAGGGSVALSFGGEIETFGDDADAIVLQSIGGGGGIGGSAGADAGTAEGGASFSGGDGSVAYDFTLDLGGRAGATGNGGPVDIDFAGNSFTHGDLAFALVAQSIGVGGGMAGTATAAGSEATPEVDITLGITDGTGGNGAGGEVTLGLTSGANVSTDGYGASLILAQSIGLGGGLAKEGSRRASGSVLLGGSAASGSNDGSGLVTVSGDVGGLVSGGDDAHLVVAQSISGGGGMAVLGDAGSADLAQSHGIDLVLGRSAPVQAAGDVTIDLGSSRITSGDRAMGYVAQSVGGGGGLATAGAAGGVLSAALGGGIDGHAGDVAVTLRRFNQLSTTGTGAHGVVAQSIGGGGGIGGDVSFAEGIVLEVFDAGPFGGLGGTGAAGSVTVTLDDDVFTSGSGAFGVIAQAVGGGGGLGGTAAGAFAGKTSGGGTGAANNTGTVRILQTDPARTLDASGLNSVALFAQNLTDTQDADSFIDIQIAGTVRGGAGDYAPGAFDAAALAASGQGIGVLVHGGGAANQLAVSGSVSAASGLAIYFLGQGSDPGTDLLTVQNSGVIEGDVIGEFRNGSSTQIAPAGSAGASAAADASGPASFGAALVLNNLEGGLLTGGQSYLADLHNDGTLVAGGLNIAGETVTIAGHFVQGAGGLISATTHAADGTTDRIDVAGTAFLDGRLRLEPVSILRDASMTVLTAEGGIEGSFSEVESALFTFEQLIEEGELGVRVADSKFEDPAFGLAEREREVASYLGDLLREGGDGQAELFGALDAAANTGSGVYADALSRLAPGASLAGAAAQFGQAGTRLDALHDCERLPGTPAQRLGSCVRAIGSLARLEQDGSGSSFGYSGTILSGGLAGQIALGEGWALGGTLGVENADLSGERGYGSADGNTLFAGVSLTKEVGRFALSAAASASWGRFDTERRLAVGGTPARAVGDQDVTSLAARLRASYTLGADPAYLRPSLDLDVVYVEAGGYTEAGAGELSLAVSGSQETALVATPAIEAGTVFAASEDLGLRAYVRAGASFSSVDSFEAEARFATAPASAGGFASAVGVADVVGRVGAGVEILSATWADVDLRYDGAFAGDFREHTASVNVAIRF